MVALVATNVIRIDALLNLVEEAVDMMQGVITDMGKTANMIYSTCKDMRDKLHIVIQPSPPCSLSHPAATLQCGRHCRHHFRVSSMQPSTPSHL